MEHDEIILYVEKYYKEYSLLNEIKTLIENDIETKEFSRNHYEKMRSMILISEIIERDSIFLERNFTFKSLNISLDVRFSYVIKTNTIHIISFGNIILDDFHREDLKKSTITLKDFGKRGYPYKIINNGVEIKLIFGIENNTYTYEYFRREIPTLPESFFDCVEDDISLIVLTLS